MHVVSSAGGPTSPAMSRHRAHATGIVSIAHFSASPLLVSDWTLRNDIPRTQLSILQATSPPFPLVRCCQSSLLDPPPPTFPNSLNLCLCVRTSVRGETDRLPSVFTYDLLVRRTVGSSPAAAATFPGSSHVVPRRSIPPPTRPPRITRRAR